MHRMGKKIKISRKLLIKVTFFAVVTVSAFLFDRYFDITKLKLDVNSSETGDNSSNHNLVNFIYPANTFSIKTLTIKPLTKNFSEVLHDKFLQRYHQLRNFQILKEETKTFKPPFYFSIHYLVFMNFGNFTADDKPHIS